jgi:hypothetical protein
MSSMVAALAVQDQRMQELADMADMADMAVEIAGVERAASMQAEGTAEAVSAAISQQALQADLQVEGSGSGLA